MIDFSLQHILQDSAYDITLSEAGFIFQTDLGIHYRVSFDEEEIVLGGCKTYQFILQKVEYARAQQDPKIEETVLAIINEFFRFNQHVLLYVCDTSDGKEGGRNRLFLRWFERHATPDRFTICTANAKVEDEMVYIAIIVDNSNPNLQAITDDFRETADALTNKPEQYIHWKTHSSPETIQVRLVSANGEVTGIGTISTKTGEVTLDNDTWYSLDGRRVMTPTKGVYIKRSAEGRLQGKNGQKVIIK